MDLFIDLIIGVCRNGFKDGKERGFLTVGELMPLDDQY
jgi:hypothetical protein